MYNFTDALIEEYLLTEDRSIKNSIGSLSSEDPEKYNKLMSRLIDANFVDASGEPYKGVFRIESRDQDNADDTTSKI